MKKIIIACLCLLLITVLATNVLAASSSMSASSKTLRRGDTVTVTASMSSGDPATSYGLMLSYDTTVFELVDGSCTVGGTLVSSFNNGFAFMFQNPTAYSGAVGTVTLRVKDTAPFGTYTVSGSASVKNGTESVAASGCSVSISVVCDHSYSDWTKADDANHSKTCSVCNDIQTEAHTWGKETINKQPSCKEEGEKTATCTTCGFTKTEKLEKTDDHVFGNLVKVDDTNHKDVCKVCNKEITQAHTWNTGTVTKKATCKEEGEKLFTCTGCKHTKIEKIAKTTTHTFSKWEKVDAEAHKRTCTVCALEETGTHSYKTTWSKDSKEHYHECSVCKDKKDNEAHIPGPEATENRAQTCKTCGYVIKAALAHKHNYATEWTTDEDGHWYTCSGCEEKGEYAAHDFENACDPDCSICGFTRETAHTFEEAWATDAQKHWHACTGCGLKEDEEAHIPGAEATEEATQTCTICDYELAPKLEPEVTEPVQEDAPAAADDGTKQSFPWWIIIVAVAAVIGVAVVVVIKKKK